MEGAAPARREAAVAGVAVGLAALLCYQAALPVLEAGLLRSLAAALLVAAAIDRLGRVAAAFLDEADEGEIVLLGLVGLYALAKAADFAGLLRPGVLAAAVVLLALAQRPVRWFAATARLLRREAGRLSALGPSGVVLGGAACTAFLLVVLPPPVGMDAMAYHLAIPMRALARGTFANPAPQTYDGYLLLKEPADVFSLALDPSGRAAGMANLLALPAGAAALARIGGPWAALLLLASPLSLVLTAHTKPDLFGWAALFWAVVRLSDRKPARAAFWACAAVFSKLTSVFLAAPVVLFAFVEAARARDKRAALAVLGWAVLPILASALPPHPRAEVVERMPGPILLWVFAFFALHLPANLEAPLSPLALPLAAAGLFRRDDRTAAHRAAAAGLVIFLGAAVVAGLPPRFGAPVFLVLAALGLRTGFPATRIGRALAVFVLGASLAAGYRIVALRQDIAGYLSGRITAEAYRAPWQTTAPLLRAADAILPPEAGRRGGPAIRLHGEHRVFPLGRDARVDDYGAQAALWAAPDPEAFLRAEGVRYPPRRFLHTPGFRREGPRAAPPAGRAGAPFVLSRHTAETPRGRRRKRPLRHRPAGRSGGAAAACCHIPAPPPAGTGRDFPVNCEAGRPDTNRKGRRCTMRLRHGIALAAAAFLSACASGQEIGSKIDDLWVATKVRSRLAAGAVGDQFKINVDVKNGVVTLRGRVETEEDKQKIEDLVRPLRGVREVRNEIVVGEAPPPSERAPEEAEPKRRAPPTAYF